MYVNVYLTNEYILIKLYLSYPIVKDGCTPIYAASEKGRADIVNLLLQAGANLNLQTNVSSLTCTYILLKYIYIYTN